MRTSSWRRRASAVVVALGLCFGAAGTVHAGSGDGDGPLRDRLHAACQRIPLVQQRVDTAIAHLTPLVELPRALALVTDGGANCSPEAVDEATRFEAYDEAVVQVVADAAAAGITTFVVGLAVADLTSPSVPDGEPDATNLHDRLDELALAGGAPLDGPDQRFYGADDQPGIEAALTAIAAALLPCVVPVDPIPLYPDAVTASVDDIDYGPALDAASCAGLEGWRYVDGETIELCGQACASFRRTGEVVLYYDIPPVPEPPQCPRTRGAWPEEGRLEVGVACGLAAQGNMGRSR